MTDAFFLEPFIDPSLLDRELFAGKTVRGAADFAERVFVILRAAEHDPEALREDDVRALCDHADSHIHDTERFFSHLVNVAGIHRQLVEVLLSRDADLDLPHPQVAWARGLIHDLSAVFDRLSWQHKELSLFFLARHLGLDDIADFVAVHSGYLEILRQIAAADLAGSFSEPELYREWRSVLNTTGDPSSLEVIESGFAGYLDAQAMLPLITLSVADLLENGSAQVALTPESLDEAFRSRMADVVRRYHDEPIEAQGRPLPLGHALVERRGLERLTSFKDLVSALAFGDDDVLENLRRRKPALWKS